MCCFFPPQQIQKRSYALSVATPGICHSLSNLVKRVDYLVSVGGGGGRGVFVGVAVAVHVGVGRGVRVGVDVLVGVGVGGYRVA